LENIVTEMSNALVKVSTLFYLHM